MGKTQFESIVIIQNYRTLNKIHPTSPCRSVSSPLDQWSSKSYSDADAALSVGLGGD